MEIFYLEGFPADTGKPLRGALEIFDGVVPTKISKVDPVLE